MAKTGPPPKPTHLKVIAGNPGKRPLNESEPKPQGNLADPPVWMSESQKKDWCYVIQNAPRGLLKRLDKGALTVWVVAEGIHREASQTLELEGTVVQNPSGRKVANPLLQIVDQQAKLMLKAAGELGFTPSSRTRISVSPAEETPNPFLDD